MKPAQPLVCFSACHALQLLWQYSEVLSKLGRFDHALRLLWSSLDAMQKWFGSRTGNAIIPSEYLLLRFLGLSVRNGLAIARACVSVRSAGDAARGGTRWRDWCWFVHRETTVLFFSLPQAPKRCWRALLEDEPTRKGLRLPVRHALSTAAPAPHQSSSPRLSGSHVPVLISACAFPSNKRSNGAVN